MGEPPAPATEARPIPARPERQGPERAWTRDGPARRRLPLRFELGLLCTGQALPILIFVGLILWQLALAERRTTELEATDFARAMTVSVDRELTGLLAAVDVLSLSAFLQSGDLEAFYRQAQEVQRRQGIIPVLRSLDGQQLVNLRLPFGAPLPRASIPADQVAMATKRATVSDVFSGAVVAAPLFAVVAPVLREGEPAYLLSLSLDVERIRRVILDERPPDRWTVAVLDREGVVIASNVGHEALAGKPATADLREITRGRDGTWPGTWHGTSHGTWHGIAGDGEPSFGAAAASRLTDWRVAVVVREADLSAPLRRSLWYLFGLGAGFAALSALLGVLFGRRITIPIRALAAQAVALGRGDEAHSVATPIREVADVGEALATASATLRERQGMLRELNATLETRVDERTRELASMNERLLEEAASRERAELQLRQAQKMEAVGRLTGGVAHDFNNLLTVVVGSLEMLRRRIDGDARTQRLVDQAIDGANRAATLTHRLLAFSRQQPLAPEPVDANKLVAGMSDMLRRTLGENIAIETVLAGGLWLTHADANQLESALLNLAVNAQDAMPEGGKLTFETANAYLDEAYAATRPDVAAGQYVMIAVCDTGSGIEPEVIAKAFEPFFTTKPIGKGTGLGLSQVYGFARQSGGHAAIYSEPGHGTTVKLYLPRFRQAGDASREAAATPRRKASMKRAKAGETVLVVEDEAMVRGFSVSALEEAGYAVLAAEDGPSGLVLLDAHPEVTLLFTDVVLTGPLNGRKVADEALKRRPGLKVLFTTGYTPNAIIHHGRLDEDVELITKPFTATTLAEKVRQVLDGRASDPQPPQR